MKTNVLVLGVGGNISQGILKALALSALPSKVYVACIDPLSVGLYIGYHEKTFISPKAKDPEFIPWLVDTILKYEINIVFSGGEEILGALSKVPYYIYDRTGCVVVISPYNIFEIGQDKLETCKWLESQGLPFPPYADMGNAKAWDLLVHQHGLPLIMKPIKSRGSKDITIVNNLEDFNLRGWNWNTKPGYILQKLIGDENEEYTVGCFSNKYGVLIESIVFKRILRDGTTYVAEAGDFPDVKREAERIVSKLRPIGPCNIQMRMNEGVPTAFEFNIRYSSSTPMRARMGFNDVEAAIKHFIYDERGSLGLRPATSGYALRYLNEVYVPEIGALNPCVIEDWGV